ncbi:hypothetical protein ACWPKS_15975 [Coraliomargarita sp. W4R72]
MATFTSLIEQGLGTMPLGVADPTTGIGVAASIGTVGRSNTTPATFWKKTGAADTDWTDDVTPADLVAAIDALVGGASPDADTLGELEGLIADARLASLLYDASWRHIDLSTSADYSAVTANGGAVNNGQSYLVGIQAGATANGAAALYVEKAHLSFGSSWSAPSWSESSGFAVDFTHIAGTTSGESRMLLGKGSSGFANSSLSDKGYGVEIRQNQLYVVSHDGVTAYEASIAALAPNYSYRVMIVLRSGTLTYYVSTGSGITTGTLTGPVGATSTNPVWSAETTNGGDSANQEIRLINGTLKLYSSF